MGWEADYDRWKTTPPDDGEPRINGTCDQCECDLYEGDEILKCENSGATLCSDECAKEWLMEAWRDHFYSDEVPYRDDDAEREAWADDEADRRRDAKLLGEDW